MSKDQEILVLKFEVNLYFFMIVVFMFIIFKICFNICQLLNEKQMKAETISSKDSEAATALRLQEVLRCVCIYINQYLVFDLFIQF